MSQRQNQNTTAPQRRRESSGLHIGLIAPDLTMKHGWAQYSLSLVRALQKTGIRLTVVAARNSPTLEGVEVHPVLPALVPRERAFTVKMLAQIPAVRRLLRDCDVIHVLAEPYGPLGAVVAGQRPLLITGHGSYVHMAEHERWPFSTLYRRAFLQSTLVCVSHYTAKVAQQALPGVRTVVVNNGVEAARFAGVKYKYDETSPWNPINIQKKNAEQNYGLIYDTHPTAYAPTVISIGAVKARKGQLELVQAMATVVKQEPYVQCIIFGSLTNDPEYVVRVRELIKALGLESKVFLTGFVSEETLLNRFATSDVFVLPSMNDGWKFEGYGLVHLEASAAGLPVIGTRDCGAEDAIDNEVTGLLVSQEQIAEQLPEAIIRLLRDPALAAQMGAAGRLKAQGRTWDVVAGEMLAVYNQIHEKQN